MRIAMRLQAHGFQSGLLSLLKAAEMTEADAARRLSVQTVDTRPFLGHPQMSQTSQRGAGTTSPYRPKAEDDAAYTENKGKGKAVRSSNDDDGDDENDSEPAETNASGQDTTVDKWAGSKFTPINPQ